MRVNFFLPLALAAASTAAAATPAIPKRPAIVAAPYGTGRDMPPSPPRDPTRVCRVKPGCKPVRDDARAILTAFEKCNDGGTVVMDRDYLIGSPLDLTFLKHIDVVITGEIAFNDADVYYWHENAYMLPFQNMSAFWRWGGEDVHIYGDPENSKSTINGRGQKYWDAFGTDSLLKRPTLFTIDLMKGATMSHLRMRNPPNWFNIIVNSTDVIISDMDLIARREPVDGKKIPNSDGWDTLQSDRIVIQDSTVINTDDCVSFKPNSTNIVVQNMKCSGSHGISVGSLGQYKGVVDIVENLYIYNTTMDNAGDAARIKIWPSLESKFQDNLNGGGGLGWVKNVTYDLFYQTNISHAITITQCYGQRSHALCMEYPSNMTIEDVTFKNFYGVAKNHPRAGTLVCSAPDRCSNIRANNIQITSPRGGAPEYECKHIDRSLLDIHCVDYIP